LAVNLVVLLVPVAGLEFARVYERELLGGLEADMRHQAVVIRDFLEVPLEAGGQLDGGHVEAVLKKVAEGTRFRTRILDERGDVVADSHRDGPPEGAEVTPPSYLRSISEVESSLGSRARSPGPRWSPLPERVEVRAALAGNPSAYTRIRERAPSVILFVSEPLMGMKKVRGVVYVTSSTVPVMTKLWRVRNGLERVLFVALAVTAAVTLILAWSITAPLSRLSRAASRIAQGEYNLPIPIGGSGEVRELGMALGTMTETLRRRLRHTASFAADVAHGFKSPLTAIRGAAELLEAGADGDAAARGRFLRNIEIDAERLDRLVSRLLELSRLESSEVGLGPVDVAPVLTEVAERCETPDVRVHASGVDAPLLVSGRREDLATALTNLVENAVRHSPVGGEVRILAQSSKDRLRISIDDDGAGVPEEHRARLFERFFTTDKEHGTGLGLPIVRVVVEALGGTVALDASHGPGARFVVELPLLTEVKARSATAGSAGPRSEGSAPA
jgi:two-component system sensor histidine kinase ChvG